MTGGVCQFRCFLTDVKKKTPVFDIVECFVHLFSKVS